MTLVVCHEDYNETLMRQVRKGSFLRLLKPTMGEDSVEQLAACASHTVGYVCQLHLHSQGTETVGVMIASNNIDTSPLALF